MIRRLVVLCGLTALVASCGGGGSGFHPSHCSPHGSSLSISAQDLRFSTDCLAAPAGQGFSITFDNNDPGQAHNVAILTSAKGRNLFKGQTIVGTKSVTYRVPALRKGTYYFRCDVHPNTMQGTFIER